MLRQLNLAPTSASQFDPTRHTVRGDISVAPPGLQILVQWTKIHQSVSRAPVLPIQEVLGHPTDLVATYCLLLASSPTISVDQPLLICLHWGLCTTVRVPILSRALSALLHTLGFDAGLYSLHSLCRGGGGGHTTEA